MPYPSLTTYPSVGLYPGFPSITVRPFWRPGSVGNGRMWISGSVDLGSEEITSIEWRINDSEWNTAFVGLLPGEDFGFFVYGDSAGGYGTFTYGANGNSGWTRPVGTYYSVGLPKPPLFVLNNSVRLGRAGSLVALDGTADLWFWDNEVLSVRLIGDMALGVVQALVEPVFNPGQSYHLEVRATGSSADIVSLIDETFVWNFRAQDNVTRFLKVMLPSFMVDSEFGQSLFRAYGRSMADVATLFEDISAQFNPATSTWTLGIWEDMIGAPAKPGVAFDDRRQIINSRRSLGSSKTDFYAAVEAISGPISITDRYSEYRIDLQLATQNDPQLRAAVERVIAEKKPVGILITVSYAAFQADISHAGDTI